MSRTRVFVLGLDGATLDIIRPMISEGELPAFARLTREGTWGPLESVASQRSAAAWSSFMTGMNPGMHGVYEFYDYVPQTYNLRFINGSARDGRSLWQILSGKDRKVGVINVPMTYPAEAVNGFLIAGLDCPSAHSRGFTHPGALAGELHEWVGEYIIEPGLTGAVVGGRVREAVELVRQEFAQKMAVTRRLMGSRPWDFFTLVLRSLDAVQHTFWRFTDPLHPDYTRAGAEAHGSIIRDTYVMIDSFIGELLDTLDDGRTALVVMSDHGFGRKHAATAQINAWLASKGHLSFSRSSRDAGRGLLRTVYRTLVGMTSRRTKEWLWQTFPDLRDRVQSRLCFANIDWSRTRAYSDSLFANVRINLQGREHDGIVAAGEEYRRLLGQLTCELKELRDSRTGEHIVQDVFDREMIYHGPYVEKAPELLIRWREDIPISGIRIEGLHSAGKFTAPPLPGEDHRFVSGDHHLHGIFFAWGPDVVKGQELQNARIVDLAPSILYQMRLPIPRSMDGEVLHAVFTQPCRDRHAPVFEGSPGVDAPKARKPTGYEDGEQETIRARLRDLGYVE